MCHRNSTAVTVRNAKADTPKTPAPAKDAKTLAASWEKADNWDGQGWADEPLSLPAAVPASDPSRVTVTRAIAAFTAEFEEYAAQATRKKYKRLLRRLQSFSDARGYAAIDQWTTIDVREFRSS